MTYADATTIYGLTRAGYVPQLFSLRLPDPTVVIELLRKANSQAIFYDPLYAADLAAAGCPVPTLTCTDLFAADVSAQPLPSMPSPITGEETVFIFHTSGSTSGSPKLIPCSFKWLDAMITKGRSCVIPPRPEVQDVNVWM
jgi:acyl-coenzyme A synthetase/AMP-(fatty) acid ligase